MSRRTPDPLARLLTAVLLVVLVLVVNRWQFSLTVLLLVVLPAVALSGKPRQIGVALVVVAGPPLVSSLLLHGLFFPGGVSVPAIFGPARMTSEGLTFAMTTGLRMTAFTGVLLTAAMTLDIPQLLAAMTHRGWNRKLVFVIGSALGLIPRWHRGPSGSRAPSRPADSWWGGARCPASAPC